MVEFRYSRTSTARFDLVDRICFKLLSACWVRQDLQTDFCAVFPRRQARARSLAIELIDEVLSRAPKRPKLNQLQRMVRQADAYQQLIWKPAARASINEVRIQTRSIQWLDWQLPRFENLRQFASHLGLTATGLDWLAKNERRTLPSHYSFQWVPKRDGMNRLIESPKQLLKQVQRIILQDVLSRIPVHDAAHGFYPGRSVLGYVHPHVGQTACLRMDLKNFFPSIRGNRVYGIFYNAGFDQVISQKLTRLTTVSTPSKILNRMTEWNMPTRKLLEQTELYRPPHLPQGAPTSPMIANVIAYRLDERLSALARTAGLNYTRYADDLLISGGDRFARYAKKFADSVAAIAIDEGFQVNFRKTQVLRHSQRQRIAGMTINEKINVPRLEFDRLKAILFNCRRFGPNSQNRTQHSHFRAHLRGRIEWMRMLNTKKAEKLQIMFDQIDWSQEAD